MEEKVECEHCGYSLPKWYKTVKIIKDGYEQTFCSKECAEISSRNMVIDNEG